MCAFPPIIGQCLGSPAHCKGVACCVCAKWMTKSQKGGEVSREGTLGGMDVDPTYHLWQVREIIVTMCYQVNSDLWLLFSGLPKSRSLRLFPSPAGLLHLCSLPQATQADSSPRTDSEETNSQPLALQARCLTQWAIHPVIQTTPFKR